jgi:hypothetical protein
MELELYPLLSTIILVTTMVTIVFALFSYLAYRARERRQARSGSVSSGGVIPVRPRLFKRYEPGL